MNKHETTSQSYQYNMFKMAAVMAARAISWMGSNWFSKDTQKATAVPKYMLLINFYRDLSLRLDY